MTPELAQLLDGPVAERFGRPTCEFGVISLDPKEPATWCSNNSACKTCKNCYPDSPPCNVNWLLDAPEPSAVWLAHLLQMCGQRGWVIRNLYQSQSPECELWWQIELEYSPDNMTELLRKESILAALAHAMLAVPENKP